MPRLEETQLGLDARRDELLKRRGFEVKDYKE
jgi:hypothetical protein